MISTAPGNVLALCGWSKGDKVGQSLFRVRELVEDESLFAARILVPMCVEFLTFEGLYDVETGELRTRGLGVITDEAFEVAKKLVLCGKGDCQPSAATLVIHTP